MIDIMLEKSLSLFIILPILFFSFNSLLKLVAVVRISFVCRSPMWAISETSSVVNVCFKSAWIKRLRSSFHSNISSNNTSESIFLFCFNQY